MDKEFYQTFHFEQQSFSFDKTANNKELNEPFKILYNARSNKTRKSRKSSASLCNQNPFRLKKPRKMTLPIMMHQTSSQIEQIYEVYSENNVPQSYSYEQNEQFYKNNKQQIIYSQMDLEKAIQFGIIQQSDLDRQSWFQFKNQNPQFPLN